MTDVARRPGDSPSKRPGREKQEQEPASEEVTEVAPGILRMQLPIWMPGLGHVNTYGLLDDRGLGRRRPRAARPAVVAGAEEPAASSAGFKLGDVHTVIVTHSHPDHFGGAGRIKREAGAALITHRAFTTWSLSRTRRRAHLPTEEAAREAERVAAAAAQALDLGEEIPTIADHADEYAGDPLRDNPTEETQAGSVPVGRRDPVGRQPARLPPLRRRLIIRALRSCSQPARPDADGSCTANASSSPAGSGCRSTRPATPSTISASSTPNTACCSPATTCCRRSRRTSPAWATAPTR